MADGRMLKKVISQSRRVSLLKNDTHRMLYTWCIAHLDIEGRMVADPDLFKGEVAPRLKHITPSICKAALLDMAEQELIILYEIDGDTYLQLRNFTKHNKVRKDKEKQSLIPPPAEGREVDGTPPAEGQGKDKIREDKIKEKNNARARDPHSPKTKYLDSVFLTAEEYKKLREVLGQKSLDAGIEKLDYSISNGNGKYKDHYKTLLNWHNRGFIVEYIKNHKKYAEGNNGHPAIIPPTRKSPDEIWDEVEKQMKERGKL